MWNLIVIVISIALMAGVSALAIQYIPTDAYIRQAMQQDVQAGLHMIENGVDRYLSDHRDTNGNIIYPGDGVSMMPLVSPTYGFTPAEVRGGLTWSVVAGKLNGLPAVGICVLPNGATSSEPAIQKSIMANVQARLPVGSAYLAAGCNATANQDGGDHLTYWVVLNHLQ